MKDFIYIRWQAGGGCGHTIGCGVTVQDISAESREEAIEKIIDLGADWKEKLAADIADDGDVEGWFDDFICDSGVYDVSSDNEFRISEGILYEVKSAMGMKPILKKKLAEANAFKTELLKKAAEDLEKQQYEALKKKFG